MAFEFLQAFARFFVDRSQFDRELKALETDAGRSAKLVEKALQAKPVFVLPFAEELPGGGGGGPEDALRKAGAGNENLAKKQKETATSAYEVARSVREVSRGLASDLNPSLGEAVSGLVAGAQAARHFGVGTGVAVGALAIASVAIGVWIQRLKAAREAQVQLSMVRLAGDFGTARSAMTGAIQELERFSEREREIAAGPGRIGGAPAGRAALAHLEKLFGEGEPELRRRLTERAKLAAETFQALEVPKRTLETNLELLRVEQQSARLDSERAQTADQVTAALDRQLKVLKDTAETQGQLTVDAARAEGQRLINEGMKAGNPELVKQGRFIAEQGQQRAKAMRDAAVVASGELVDVNRRRIAEIEALEIEALVRQTERENRRAAFANQVAKERLQIERAFVVARAEAEGQVARGLEGFQADRRRLVEEGVQTELAGLEKVTRGQEAALRARIGGAIGDERVRLERQLTDFLADQETTRTEIRERGATAVRQLDLTDFQERQAQIRAELALEEARFKARVGMGQATANEEVGQLLSAAGDFRRTEQERLQAAVDARGLMKKLDQDVFDFRRAAGQATLVDELYRQRQLVDAAKVGTQERFALEKGLVEKIAQFRQQTAAAAGGILGLVGGQFGGEAFTKKELENAFKERQKQAEEIARRFQRGGAVTQEELNVVQQVAPLKEQVRQLGGGIGEILSEGFGQINQPLADAVGQIGQQSMAALADAVASGAGDVGQPIVSAYQVAFNQVLDTVDSFVATFDEKIKAGSTRVARSLFDAFYDELPGRIEREQSRLV